MIRINSTRRRCGFTLIELVLSLSLVGVVLVALGSILSLSMRAMPQSSDAASHIRNAAFPVNVMTEELGSAIEFLAITSREVRFRVNDRTGDGLPETITYSWSGTPGDPVLRRVNTDDFRPLIESVRHIRFGASVQTRTQTTRYTAEPVAFMTEASENTSLLGSLTALLNSQKRPIRLTQGFFQQMRHNPVPVDALYWTPQRVSVRLERNSTPGAIRLEARTVDAGNPSGVALASVVIRAEDLGAEAWIHLDIPGSIRLPRSTRVGVMLVGLEGDGAIRVRTFDTLVFNNEAGLRQSSDSGSTWSNSLIGHVSYRLRGTHTSEAKQEVTTETIIDRLALSIEPIEVNSTHFHTSIDFPAPVRVLP